MGLCVPHFAELPPWLASRGGAARLPRPMFGWTNRQNSGLEHDPGIAHASFRGPLGRHDRAAGEDDLVLRRGRVRRGHRRPQPDPPVGAFRRPYLVRHPHRPRALYGEPHLGGAGDAPARAGRGLHFADPELPRAGQDRRHRRRHRDGGRAHSRAASRPSDLHLQRRRRDGARRRGAGEGAVVVRVGDAAAAAIRALAVESFVDAQGCPSGLCSAERRSTGARHAWLRTPPDL